MTKKAITKAQEYLTVIYPDGERVYQIVNIELLLHRHSPQEVISFLQKLRKDCKYRLRWLLKNNVSDARINEAVAKNFRLKMCINTIKNYEREVIAA